jgi:hypothetical protein
MFEKKKHLQSEHVEPENPVLHSHSPFSEHLPPLRQEEKTLLQPTSEKIKK